MTMTAWVGGGRLPDEKVVWAMQGRGRQRLERVAESGVVDDFRSLASSKETIKLRYTLQRRAYLKPVLVSDLAAARPFLVRAAVWIGVSLIQGFLGVWYGTSFWCGSQVVS
jgi:hypothetical protein